MIVLYHIYRYGRNKDSPSYGKSPSEETLKKMSKANTGENNPSAKLTEADVLDIRKWYKEGMKQREIAKIKSIACQSVSGIVNYKKWKHVI